ncbi:MAG TPA: hypothetical protein PKD04_01835, partial [Rhodocyclaceae bacterium]|nr:hypothetical protein [Rhodocyclaceae bacterium]
MNAIDDDDKVDFGPMPPEVSTLIQQGVAAYFDDRNLAERLFLEAVSLAPDVLAARRCLVKHYN